MHGVEFPVAEAGAPFHYPGTLTDHRLASQSASSVVATVALPPLLLRTAQAPPQRAPTRPLRPDIQVDGLMAHHRQPLPPAPAHDLFRTPLLPQPLFDDHVVRGAIPSVAPRPTPPPVGHLDCHRRPVRSIMRRAVPLHLTVDRAAMSSQFLGNRRYRAALLAQCRNHVSFLVG